jgi:predicted DsbA family dithiol-disulfide isomerase
VTPTAAAPASERLAIDVFSDVVCPWCLIGVRRLEQALAERPDVQAEVTFHPFLLDPNAPAGGADLREHLRKKYGGDPERMFSRVEAAAREAGIALDFSKIRRFAPTTPAHVLIEAAAASGRQHEMKRAMLSAYFLEGLDIADPEVLVGIAREHGLEEDQARAALADPAAAARVRATAAEASEQGVSGVPFFVFGGRLAFSGAQPLPVFLQVIDRARAESRAQAKLG